MGELAVEKVAVRRTYRQIVTLGEYSVIILAEIAVPSDVW